MASAAIEADSAPVTHPATIPPPPAVMAILDRFNSDEIGNTIEVLVALLDIWDAPLNPDEPDFRPTDGDGLPGDPKDEEDSGDAEHGAYIEWQTMRGSQKRGPNVVLGHEDDEDDDPAEEDDPQGECSEDEISCGAGNWGGLYGSPDLNGPGCPISDPGGCQHD